jgi:hypothetical protein
VFAAIFSTNLWSGFTPVFLMAASAFLDTVSGPWHGVWLLLAADVWALPTGPANSNRGVISTEKNAVDGKFDSRSGISH